jgi:hypothetical protein
VVPHADYARLAIALERTWGSAQIVLFGVTRVAMSNDREWRQIGGYRTRRERLLVTFCNLTPSIG